MAGKGESKDGRKIVAVNKKARHEYAVLDTIECGLKLTGSEIKSVREGNASIKEAYGRIVDDEPLLLSMTIAPYPNSTWNPEPNRPRKLLLHKREIRRILAEIKVKGRTWIPLSMYFVRGLLKIEMGICIGKKLYDKRETMKKADAKRDIDRAMSRRR